MTGRSDKSYGNLLSKFKKKEISKKKPPIGMVFIKGGTFLVGPYGNNIYPDNKKFIQSIVSPFFMDQELMKNGLYRCFLDDVLLNNDNQETNNNESDKLNYNDSIQTENDGLKSKDGFLDEKNEEKNQNEEKYKNLVYKGIKLYPNFGSWQELNIGAGTKSFHDRMGDSKKGYFITFLNYPVVGVHREAAVLMGEWRTKMCNSNYVYRLPDAIESEYVWKCGKSLVKYSCESNYPKDKIGNPLMNIKFMRGSYGCKDLVGPCDSKKFPVNDFGLYSMSGGNLYIWTSSNKNNLAIVVGGSWSSCNFYAQPGNYLCTDEIGKANIGFRHVVSC
jgi:formylglycine-generating enzyme required for sulfatase activity